MTRDETIFNIAELFCDNYCENTNCIEDKPCDYAINLGDMMYEICRTKVQGAIEEFAGELEEHTITVYSDKSEPIEMVSVDTINSLLRGYEE